MSKSAPQPFVSVTRRVSWSMLVLLLVLPPAFAEVPKKLPDGVPNTAPRKGNVDDARGYQPIHHPPRVRSG